MIIEVRAIVIRRLSVEGPGSSVRGGCSPLAHVHDAEVDVLTAARLLDVDGDDVAALAQCRAPLRVQRHERVAGVAAWELRDELTVEVHARVLVVKDAELGARAGRRQQVEGSAPPAPRRLPHRSDACEAGSACAAPRLPAGP